MSCSGAFQSTYAPRARTTGGGGTGVSSLSSSIEPELSSERASSSCESMPASSFETSRWRWRCYWRSSDIGGAFQFDTAGRAGAASALDWACSAAGCCVRRNLESMVASSVETVRWRPRCCWRSSDIDGAFRFDTAGRAGDASALDWTGSAAGCCV